MNGFDTSDWDVVLTSALTIPGAPYPDGQISRDSAAFVWGRWNSPRWSAAQAFANLGITRMDFPAGYAERLAGFATAGRIVALNPRTRLKVRTAAHELAHVMLRHTDTLPDESRIPIEEFEADCTALLICHALNIGAAELADCRHYIQHYAKQPCAGPLPRTWDAIKAAALQILSAGAGQFVVVPEPPPLAVQPARQFAARLHIGSW